MVRLASKARMLLYIVALVVVAVGVVAVGVGAGKPLLHHCSCLYDYGLRMEIITVVVVVVVVVV